MLKAEGLCKEYPTPAGPLQILNGVSLDLRRGDAVAIMGPSGSGKSTLIYILGALEPPTSGIVTVDGHNPFELTADQLAKFRNEKIGFVFQDHCLLPQCSALENVLIPTFVGPPDADKVNKARKLLDRVGLSNRVDHRPGALSGGEKQRVALARALIQSPLIVLCDEPTGNLDRSAAESIADLLVEIHKQRETILLVVTHNPDLAARFPARLELVDGRLQPIQG
ncbi:MAG TPA: ABC transporter ATP-binding protein [Acidobacteriota bacterium]|jgi:lipoprotein-releasing system ATP-binding protein